MSAEHETPLKELFHRMREEDELSMPSFNRTIEPRSRSSRWDDLGFPRLKVAAALLALIVVVIPVLTHLSQDSSQPGEEIVVDVLAWEPPTDFLLTYSEEPLLTTVPSIDIQVPEWVEEGVLESLDSEGMVDDS